MHVMQIECAHLSLQPAEGNQYSTLSTHVELITIKYLQL